jgi:hypothetical protein
MKELDIGVFVAVFIEMLGPVVFWALVLAATILAAAFVYVLIRDRGLESRRVVRAELAGVLGGIAAVLIMQRITNSGFRDLGGPIDWLLVLAIFAFGGLATTILAYTLQAMAGGPPEPRQP